MRAGGPEAAVDREPMSVHLSIPVQADLVVLARLTAATVAARAQFGVEDIEDLRLAVEELCLSLVHPDDEGRLHFTFDYDAEAITVTCWLEPQPGWESSGRTDDDDLSLRILDALVDEHGREQRQGQTCAWLRKRRARSTV
ncbi:MAG: ATP-binding protein [Acidimicrobiales bacterium]